MRWETRLAIDFDKHAVACYRANFPAVRVEQADVGDSMRLFSRGMADVFLGGPPCVSFSKAGKRKLSKDARDCVPDFIEAVGISMPRNFVMENVDGMLCGDSWLYFTAILRAFEMIGYVVDYRVLDAVNYGVPQFRKRVWVVGQRKDVFDAREATRQMARKTDSGKGTPRNESLCVGEIDASMRDGSRRRKVGDAQTSEASNGHSTTGADRQRKSLLAGREKLTSSHSPKGASMRLQGREVRQARAKTMREVRSRRQYIAGPSSRLLAAVGRAMAMPEMPSRGALRMNWFPWPAQTHCWPAEQGEMLFGAKLKTGITVGEALGITGWLRGERGAGLLERGGPRRDVPTTEPSPSIQAGNAGSGCRYQVVTHCGPGYGDRRDVGIDEPSPTVQAKDGGGWDRLSIQSHADPAQSIELPSPTLRSGGNGHDGCCLRVIGAGRHDVIPKETRDITNEPSQTIVGQWIGHQQPEVVYDHGIAYADSPCPTLKAGSNTDERGHMGGGCPPVVAWRWSDAWLAKHPPSAPSAPSATVTSHYARGAPDGMLAMTEWKHKGELWVRRLAPLECARLQSVPDSFVWPDGFKKSHAYRVIGNGWASGMAAAMSRSLGDADPDSRSVVDLFCGGGLGAVGWHGRYWSCDPESSCNRAGEG